MKDISKESQEKRIKHKHKIHYGTSDYYKYFLKYYDTWSSKSKFDTQEYEFKTKLPTRGEYNDILSDFFSLSSKSALEDNEPIELFGNFGSISIKKYPPYIKNSKGKISLPVDWKLSKQLGKKIYLTNDDRDGFIYRWTWDKKINKVKCVQWYKFIPARANARAVKQVLQDKSKDFFLGFTKKYNK